jgi:uncharacterized membrane protein YfcA
VLDAVKDFPHLRRVLRIFQGISLLGAVILACSIVGGPLLHWFSGGAMAALLTAGCAYLIVGLWLWWRGRRVLTRRRKAERARSDEHA